MMFVEGYEMKIYAYFNTIILYNILNISDLKIKKPFLSFNYP